MTGPVVLLVEFVPVGRFTLSRSFPFLNGWLKRRGDAVTWLRFGVAPDVQAARGEVGVGLAEADAATLLDAVRRGASHVLLTHPPAPGLARRLEATGVRTRVAAGDDGDVRWVADAVGAPPPSLAETEPDFGLLAANDAARTLPALAYVLTGSDCLYRAPVAANPAYAGVDLSGCRAEGCAFCTDGAARSGLDGQPVVETAMRQVRALLATHPSVASGARPQLRLTGHRVLAEVAGLARAMRDARAPALDLLLEARTDQLVASEERLAAAAAALGGSGHRLHVCLVGIESFSRAELVRMNKGVAPWVNLAAIRVLRTLERRHPDVFRFREHRGLSTILFTPWTTLDDVALNLEVARHFDLGPVLGKLLGSRLRLHDGTAMTALARRDGLLATAHADPALDIASRNLYAPELPWRFAHPEVEPVNRILARLEATGALVDDPLTARIRAWRGPVDPLDAASAVVQRALAAPAGARGLEALLSPPLAGPPPALAAPDPDPHEPMIEVYLALQRAGLSRVNRIESLDARVSAVVAARARGAGREVAVAAHAGEAARQDVFFGAAADEVREAAELTARLADAQDPASVAAARARIGELYGYPACCAAAYAAASSSLPTRDEWLLVLRRSEHAGPSPASLDPMSLALPYVFCSFRCEASVARARRAREALAGVPGALRWGEGDPLVVLLDRPGQMAKLSPATVDGRTIAFAGSVRRGSDPRLRALDGGGILTVDGGAVVVERDGARIASFFMTAAVLWPGGAFDPEFWSEAARHVLDPAEPRADAGEEGGRGSDRRPASPLVRSMRAVLPAAPGALGGYTLSAVEVADHAARLVLAPAAAEGDPLELFVEPRSATSRYFCVAGELGIAWSQRTPLRTDAQRRALAAVASALSGGAPTPSLPPAAPERR